MRYTNATTIMLIESAIERADIRDGTFMVVQQEWLVELTVYSTKEFDTTWAVEIRKIPDGHDTICNSSYATGNWFDDFTADRTVAYFNDSTEAHRYMCAFIMGHQIDGV